MAPLIHTPAHDAAKNQLLAGLRREPFRPIMVESLQSINPNLKIEPRPVHISGDGYRTLYREAITITDTPHGPSLSFFEVGFNLEGDGSVRQTRRSGIHNGIMKKLLGLGLAEIHLFACASWEAMANRRGFDPNDEDNLCLGWFDLILAPSSLPERLTRQERRIFDKEIPYGELGFHYLDGYPSLAYTPKTRNAPHTHTVTHGNPEHYLPSFSDWGSPVLWAVIDQDFIRGTLAERSLPTKAKAEAILEHHVRGMENAVCIGTINDANGLRALIRTDRGARVKANPRKLTGKEEKL